jgi:hypothetical protein
MGTSEKRTPPKWFYSIIAIGALVACGMYLGMIRVEGSSAGHLIRVAGFGVVGLATFWGAVAGR